MARGQIVLIAGSLFLFGTLTAGWQVSIYFVFLIGSVTFLVFYLYDKFSHLVGFRAIYLLFFVPLLLGFFYYYANRNWQQATQILPPETQSEFTALVLTEPDSANSIRTFEAGLLPPYRGQVKVIASAVVSYGDLVTILGTVASQPRDSFAPPLVEFPRITIRASDRGFWLKSKLIRLRNGIVGSFRLHLPQEPAALLSGLTLGQRGDFSPELKAAMATSGTTHLVALSGYNISIIILAFANILSGRVTRRFAFILVTLGILLFVLMTGAEASIVRAALMGFIALSAREAGRLYSFGHGIVLAAVIMTLVSPTLPSFDIGFQLSFLSLLGITYLSEPLGRYFRFRPGSDSILAWRDNLITTLAAQLAVAPLLLQQFHQVSLTAVFANVLILGLVPLTMFSGLVLALVSFVSFYLARAVAWLAYLLLAYELGVIKLFARLALPLPAFLPGWFFATIYYLGLLLLIMNAPKLSLRHAS